MKTQRLDIALSICVAIFAFFLIVSSFNAGYNISLALVCVLGIYRLYKHNWSIPKPPLWIIGVYGCFVLTLLISALYHGGSTIPSTLKYIYWAFPFIPLFLSYVKDKTELAFFTGSTTALLTLSIKGWQQIYHMINSTHIGELRVTSMFFSPNGFGQIIEQALPIAILGAIWSIVAWRQTKLRIYKWSAAYQCIGVLLGLVPFMGALSRGAILGFIVGGAIVALLYAIKSIKRYYKRIVAILCCIGVVAGGSYMINEYVTYATWGIRPGDQMQSSLETTISTVKPLDITNSTNIARPYDVQRLHIWTSSYHMWEDHRWFGVGFDQWQYQYEHHYIMNEATERSMPMPHNNTIYFFSATGIVGGVGYLLFTIGIWGYMVRRFFCESDGLLVALGVWTFTAVTIHGQVDAGITNKFVMHIIMGILGLVCAYIANTNTNKNKK